MYCLCAIFLIADFLYFIIFCIRLFDNWMAPSFLSATNVYISFLCFLMLTGLTVLCYVGHLIKKNGESIEKNTRKKKKRAKRLIVVRCDDEDLRGAIYNTINNKGDIPLTCADAITDKEEEKLWYLTARIEKGSCHIIKISITDYEEKELYSLSRSSHDKSNSLSLITYDLEKTL